MEDWMGILLGLLVILPIVAAVTIVSSCMQLDRITDIMERVFKGKAADDLDIALKSGLTMNDLCKPLTSETLQRLHACTQVKRQRLQTELRHPLKLLVSICELDVSYDFEGTEPDGQSLTVSETARVHVHFEQSRYSRVMVIRRVELVEKKG